MEEHIRAVAVVLAAAAAMIATWMAHPVVAGVVSR